MYVLTKQQSKVVEDVIRENNEQQHTSYNLSNNYLYNGFYAIKFPRENKIDPRAHIANLARRAVDQELDKIFAGSFEKRESKYYFSETYMKLLKNLLGDCYLWYSNDGKTVLIISRNSVEPMQCAILRSFGHTCEEVEEMLNLMFISDVNPRVKTIQKFCAKRGFHVSPIYGKELCSRLSRIYAETKLSA